MSHQIQLIKILQAHQMKIIQTQIQILLRVLLMIKATLKIKPIRIQINKIDLQTKSIIQNHQIHSIHFREINFQKELKLIRNQIKMKP